jgi:ribosomal protein S6
MNRYKITSLLPATLESIDLDKLLENIQKTTEKNSTKKTEISKPIKIKLAYEIKKTDLVTMVEIVFEAEPEDIKKVRNELMKMPGVLRFLIHKTSKDAKISERFSPAKVVKSDKTKKSYEIRKPEIIKEKTEKENKVEKVEKPIKKSKAKITKEKVEKIKKTVLPKKVEKKSVKPIKSTRIEIEEEAERMKKLDAQLDEILKD